MKLKKLLLVRLGFSVIEALVATVIFTIMIMAFLGSFILFQKSYLFYGDENRASFVAEEGLEAVRNIYDEKFDNLIDGEYGLDYSGGEWKLSGLSDVEGIYTRKIIISTIDSDTKKVISDVTWQRNNLSTGSISLSTYFTNWRKSVSQDGCLTANIENACFDVSSNYQLLVNMTITNNCDYDIDMDSVQIDWDNEKKLENIDIDEQTRWSYNCSYNCSPMGSQNSGALLKFGDNILTISKGSTLSVNKIYWDGNMTGSKIGPIIFGFKDGSSSIIEAFSPPVCSFPDTIPPVQITDLSFGKVTTSTLILSWTAPGDDGNIGTATAYDIRYSTDPITDLNWSGAIQVVGEPTPLASGTIQQMNISGLMPDTQYYFAIKTYDEVLNISPLSNIVSVKTQILATQADYLDVNISGRNLSSNKMDVQGIQLRNTGNSNITIAQMTISWTTSQANTRLTQIRINNSTVWSGTGVSGQVYDITDVSIPALTTRNIDRIRFNKTLNNTNFNMTIVFTMLDGSTKTVAGITF